MTTVWLDLWRDIVVVRRRFSPVDTAYQDRCSWLDRAADHPVVRIVHRDQDHHIISTAFVGSATLASLAIPAADGARLIAALSKVIHRLHAEGLVHGALTADHVIVAGNRFWLCSPAESGEAARGGAADVAAIGRLCQDMLIGWEADRRSGLDASGRRKWNDLAAAAADPSMSAARLAARADRL